MIIQTATCRCNANQPNNAITHILYNHVSRVFSYIMRAEAYLGLDKTTEVAADINVVRARSKALPITPGQETIDYILDERLREFGVEEKRILTLLRPGKWVARVRRFNPFYGTQMQDYFNLWPIPADEIERKRSAKLDQNPGYPQ